ncbi:MAG: lipocalin family protein [Burkholderiales bacterium]|nr:lipocalin family protein [Burkholderiales bacterium]
MSYIAALSTTLATISIAAIASEDLPEPPNFDLNRYLGTWHEVARLPNQFQQRCIGDVTANYALQTNGTIAVSNRCRTSQGTISAEGVARVVDADAGRLEVRFAPAWLSWLPHVWADYRVIDVEPDYSLAMVGEAGREYLWILSRTPSADRAKIDALLAKAQSYGFPVEQIIRD